MGPNELEFMKFYRKIPDELKPYLSEPEHREHMFEQFLKIHHNTNKTPPDPVASYPGIEFIGYTLMFMLVFLLLGLGWFSHHPV